MHDDALKKLVIVGGGTAGWIAAATLAKFVAPAVAIELVESDAIGTIGVGEATIPQIIRLIGMLGIDERDMMRASGATFKLGIEFKNWHQRGARYFHSFGHTGIDLNTLDFHHYWVRSLQEGKDHDFWDFSLHHKAAYAHKFSHLKNTSKSGISDLAYAFHFDAGLFAKFLRNYAQDKGVKRTEGKIVAVNPDTENGFIKTLTLESGMRIEGDFFIDCSGFRALLINQALGVGYRDWSHWLPCDRAVAIASERAQVLRPYTMSTAHRAGWQWSIPLQHRTGNGYVYCSEFLTQDEANTTLLENLDTPVISEPNHVKFTTGRREKFFEKNCLALGLSGGFMEPLESTSIHLIQVGIDKLLALFPDKKCSKSMAHEYNRQMIAEVDAIRDFLILHYHRTDREDSAFWRYCKNMKIPDSLRDKMELFVQTGILHKHPDDLFGKASWAQVLIGQGMLPRQYHRRADLLSSRQLEEFLSNIKRITTRTSSTILTHEAYIQRYCPVDRQ